MRQKKLPTGSWIDCLDAIENELDSLKQIQSNIRDRAKYKCPDSYEFQEKLIHHEMKTRFELIWQYAGTAVKDFK